MSEEQQKPTPAVVYLILGIFLVFLFGSGLFSMEKHFSGQKITLSEIRQKAIIMPSASRVDPTYDGKLVHTQGNANTTQSLQDARFGIDVKALGLVYKVEYYQDVNTGEGFDVDWTNTPAKFLNPQDYAVNAPIMASLVDKTEYVKEATLGGYAMGENLLHGLRDARPLDLRVSPEQLEALHVSMLEEAKKALHVSDSVEVYLKALQEGDSPRILAKIVDNTLYLGNDPNDPQLGDIRLSFDVIPEQEVSTLAVIHGSSIDAYEDARGEAIPLIYAGRLNTEEVIAMRGTEDNYDVWLLRVLFGTLIVFGARMIISYFRRDAIEKGVPSSFCNVNPWGPTIALGLVLTVLISLSGQIMG